METIARKVFLPPVVFLSLLLPFPQNALADHLPPELQARGKPERVLAGIHLGMTLRDVIARYGQPRTKQHDPDGSDEYSWLRSGVTLRVSFYPGDVKGREFIGSIDIKGGPTKNIVGRTGRGLGLGDSLRALRRIYGSRFHERKLPKEGIHDVMVQWTEEVSLIAKIDSSGHISTITLLPPE